MKTERPNSRSCGFTRIELLVIIGTLVLLAVVLLPALGAAKRKGDRIYCVNNLMQIGGAFRVWEGDHDDKYPMQVALTNSGTMKLMASGSAYVFWQTMSNVINTPFILHCPADTNTIAATKFTSGFSDANISYFFSLDAFESYPEMILDGDDNLAVDGVRAKPGILTFSANSTVAWTKERHHGVGNIGMADGSVMQTTSTGLNSAVVLGTSGVPTNYVPNRWVIP